MTSHVEETKNASPASPPIPEIISQTGSTIRLEGSQQVNRTFLLGDQGGFVVYQPVEQNARDRTLVPIKWFGASEFGRKYLEATLVSIVRGGKKTRLDRKDQTRFEQSLEHAERVYTVDGWMIRQTFFVPNRCRAMVMMLEADGPGSGGNGAEPETIEFELEPEFDMRYYQAFNSDFSQYKAEIVPSEVGDCLRVTNCITIPSGHHGTLSFYAQVGATGDNLSIELLPENDRLRQKTYIKDEEREKQIIASYQETHQNEQTQPDEAPIWDTYSTTVYGPARLTAKGSVCLVYAFGDEAGDAEDTFRQVRDSLARLREEKRQDTIARLQQGALACGDAIVDQAYEQVITRFNNCLVARDVTIRTGSYEIEHWSAIFAGNKYFLDAWKRDENISLIALLATSDYAAVRAILSETWQYQDRRTGRLPHIIRLGEPLVYFSSDGTLWALRRLFQYTRATGDTALLDEKYPMVEHFFSASLDFVKRGLLPSGGIVDKAYLWETWEDTPYTPRDGYPVEIELLWLTALGNFLPTIQDRNPPLAKRLEEALQAGQETFKLFYLDGYLADSLSYDWQPRPILTPNGYVAFALDYPLPDALKHSMVLLGRKQLAGQVGIRSLAPRDWRHTFSPEFLADPSNFHADNMASVGIYNYHRGVEWNWLNQFFVDGELACGETEVAYSTYLRGQVNAALHKGGVGGLSELYDLRGPLGADFQAWSMASFIQSLHSFAGISVDAVDRYVHVRPSIPPTWPYLKSRQQVGDTRYDIHFEDKGGTQTVEVEAIDHVPKDYTLRLGVRVPPQARIDSIALDGEPVPATRWQHKAGCAPSVDGEVWIEAPFAQRAIARFQISRGGHQ